MKEKLISKERVTWEKVTCLKISCEEADQQKQRVPYNHPTYMPSINVMISESISTISLQVREKHQT